MNDPTTIIEPLAGYFIDVASKLRNKVFTPHSLTKLHNIIYCRNETGARTVIEVGSFKGLTTLRLSYMFEKVISLEIDKALYQEACRRCAKRTNVELVHGDGAELLPEVATRVSKCLIYLDGHYSGGVTSMGDEPEPVLKELDSVGRNLDNFAAVIVDDFRLFGVEAGWPTKSQLLQKLEFVLPQSQWAINILYDQVIALRKGGPAYY